MPWKEISMVAERSENGNSKAAVGKHIQQCMRGSAEEKKEDVSDFGFFFPVKNKSK